MKIALVNPWRNAAENQLIPSMTQVFERYGHAVVVCRNSRDILRHRPDLVLSMSRTSPKLTDTPTYGLVFDPRDILLEQPAYFHTLLSFDGVFTMFETLQTFLSDLKFTAGRLTPVGHFYPTAPVVTWDEPVAFEDASLAYFGINWDRRKQGLFALLDHRPWMEIYGPEHGWSYLTGTSYKGVLPFDGASVLAQYHRAGAGLCLFSESHLADNIVTSRVFEICTAEAVLIAPRMPWLEHHFGDAVLYIDQESPDEVLAGEIDRHMTWIRSHPDDARALAARSHQIFRERFSLDVLTPNVVEHHDAVRTAVAATAAAFTDVRVSVLVLCFGTSAAAISRTLQSVLRQETGAST